MVVYALDLILGLGVRLRTISDRAIACSRIAMLLRVNGEVQVAERVERIDLRGRMEVLHGFL